MMNWANHFWNLMRSRLETKTEKISLVFCSSSSSSSFCVREKDDWLSANTQLTSYNYSIFHEWKRWRRTRYAVVKVGQRLLYFFILSITHASFNENFSPLPFYRLPHMYVCRCCFFWAARQKLILCFSSLIWLTQEMIWMKRCLI